MYKIYEVQEGETIFSVAQKLNIAPNVLANLNGLNSNSVLNKGTYIIIPGEDIMFDLYTVKKGDTVYAIASRYGIKPAQLQRLNGLNNSDYIYPDQQLYVPKEGVSFFITTDGNTLDDVTATLNTSASDVANQNKTIYLVPDQLIVYKK